MIFVRCDQRLAQVDASGLDWPAGRWIVGDYHRGVVVAVVFSSSVKFNVRGPCRSITLVKVVLDPSLVFMYDTLTLAPTVIWQT